MARPQAPLGWVTDQTDHGPKAEENPEAPNLEAAGCPQSAPYLSLKVAEWRAAMDMPET